MSYSPAAYTGDGATTSFSVPFPYIEEDHVVVTVDGVVQTSGFSFLSTSTIGFSVAPAAAAAIVVSRSTPVDQLLAVLTGGSVLKSADLTLIHTQFLYASQELAYTGTVLQTAVTNTQQIELTVTQAQTDVQALVDSIETEYDLSAYISTAPTQGQTVLDFVVPRAVSLPVSATGSLAEAATAPSGGTQVFTINKNGSSIGTVTFADGSTTGAFAVATAVSFAAGDNLSLVATTVDDDFTTLSITLRLDRS